MVLTYMRSERMDHYKKLDIAINMLLSTWDDEKREEVCKQYLREYYQEVASDEEQYELIDEMNVDGQPIGVWL